MSEPFSLRQAQPDDQAAVVALMAGFCRHFSYPMDELARHRAVGELLAKPHLGSIWLIGYVDQLIGYVALTYGFTFEWGGRDAFVDEFYLEPDYRNQGVGRQALSVIQQKTKELGLFALHLQTEAYNERARKLYEGAGFVDLHRNTLTWLVAGY